MSKEDTYNYCVTIKNKDYSTHRPYKRVVKASTIKPFQAIEKTFKLIEQDPDNWIWQSKNLVVEVEVVS